MTRNVPATDAGCLAQLERAVSRLDLALKIYEVDPRPRFKRKLTKAIEDCQWAIKVIHHKEV